MMLRGRAGSDRAAGGRSAPGRRLRELADFFLPAACAGCGERLPTEGASRRICGRCRSRLRPPAPPLCRRCGLPRGTGAGKARECEECRRWPPILLGARSAVILRPPADRLVHALKYGGWRELAGPLGRRMARVRLPAPARDPHAVVVPVPTTRTRRRRRGYNQAAALATVVARELGLPGVRALRRRPGGRTQVALQPVERDRNVRRAFSARGAEASRIRGRAVLLVDDVLTTGATAAAAARALESAGARGVVLLTFARALPYRASS